jgi:hypothetical protein
MIGRLVGTYKENKMDIREGEDDIAGNAAVELFH